MKKAATSLVSILSVAIVYAGAYLMINNMFIIKATLLKLNLANNSPMFLNVIVIVALVFTFFISLLIIRLKKERMLVALNIRKINFKFILLSVLMGILIALIPIIIDISPRGGVKWTTLLHIIDFIKNQNIMRMMESTNILKNTTLIFLNSLLVYTVGIVCMEFILRGIILTELKRLIDVKLAILIQALLAGLLFYNNLLSVLFAFVVGILLGMACYIAKSVWASIIIHVTLMISLLINPILEMFFLYYQPAPYNVADIVSMFVQRSTNNMFSYTWQQVVLLILDILFILTVLFCMVRRAKRKGEEDIIGANASA